MTDFTDFGLARPIMQALADEGHTTPTPIQAKAIAPIMSGRDFLGLAQTGTGKTAAFALPVLHRLAATGRGQKNARPRVVVLTPTRELAAQVLERFNAYGGRLRLRAGLVIGGASINKQKAMMRRGLDIVVATPGRLMDLINQGAVDLNAVETFILDEVDQMLDLGFIHTIRAVAAKLPQQRQNVFFSATMPPAIAKLAGKLLNDPVRAEIAAKQRPMIDQSVVFLEKGAKTAMLTDIVKRKEFTRGLVFTRTKHGADKVVRLLNASGVTASAIHGNRSQSQRERALAAFRSGKAPILVATDIAARGIDVREVSHVVNYDLPNVPETYVHRIGRTARAGATGAAISFCSHEERPYLRSIEKLTRQTIPVVKMSAPARQAARKPANDDRRKSSGNTSSRADVVSFPHEQPAADGASVKKTGFKQAGVKTKKRQNRDQHRDHHRDQGDAARPKPQRRRRRRAAG